MRIGSIDLIGRLGGQKRRNNNNIKLLLQISQTIELDRVSSFCIISIDLVEHWGARGGLDENFITDEHNTICTGEDTQKKYIYKLHRRNGKD